MNANDEIKNQERVMNSTGILLLKSIARYDVIIQNKQLSASTIDNRSVLENTGESEVNSNPTERITAVMRITLVTRTKVHQIIGLGQCLINISHL